MNSPITLRVIVTAVIFNTEGKILLQKRRDNQKWELPGGEVNTGESLVDAIKREVREETGLNVDVVRLVGVYSEPSYQIIKYADGRVLHCIAINFECKASSGILKLSNETKDLNYFDLNFLPSNILPNHLVTYVQQPEPKK